MSGNRRRFFQDAAFFGAGILSLTEALRGGTQSDPQAARTIEQGRHHSPYGDHKKEALPPQPKCPDPYLPMLAPDLKNLPHEMDGAVKVFKLIAEPVKCKIAPFKTIDVWGYNGSCPGPSIQVQQGERVRITGEAVAALKKLERLRSFFRFACENGNLTLFGDIVEWRDGFGPFEHFDQVRRSSEGRFFRFALAERTPQHRQPASALFS